MSQGNKTYRLLVAESAFLIGLGLWNLFEASLPKGLNYFAMFYHIYPIVLGSVFLYLSSLFRNPQTEKKFLYLGIFIFQLLLSLALLQTTFAGLSTLWIIRNLLGVLVSAVCCFYFGKQAKNHTSKITNQP